MSGPESGGFRALAKNLALAAASLAVFLVLAEAAATFLLRGGGGPTPGVRDPVVGFRLRPNNTYTEVGGAVASTNSRGFRGPEVVLPRPAGGIRILALGDSSTFGYGVTPAEDYPGRLERLLSRRFPGRAVEVINAGTPGWDSANGLAFLVSEGLSWKPDVVLVSFGYNEQLGSGPGAPHYDYDPRAGRVRYHPLGEAVRTLVPPPPDEGARVAPAFSDRFRNFPRNLRFFLLLQRGVHDLQQGIYRVLGSVKSSRLASRFLAMLYARQPELVYRPLRVRVEGNHVLEAYVSHLEQTVRRCRKAGVAVVFVLQPRRAYQELLDVLPEAAGAANSRAAGLVEAGRPAEAIALLSRWHAERPEDALTTYDLALALELEGEDARALALLEQLLALRPFTMNALMQQVAIRMDVPIVPTPLSFVGSPRRDLFFPDRYHTRSDGYALVADDVLRTLEEEGLLRHAPIGGSAVRGSDAADGPGALRPQGGGP